MIFEQNNENETTQNIFKHITALSGLAHDLGKASINFQNKLRRSEGKWGENIRHEWLSMRLTEELIALFPRSLTNTHEAWVWWESSWEALRNRWFNGSQKATARVNQNFHAFKTHNQEVLAPTTLKGALLINIATHHKLFGGSESDLQTSRHTNRVATKDIGSSDFDDWCYLNASQRWTESDKEMMANVLKKFHNHWEKLEKYERTISKSDAQEFWQGISYVSRAALIVSDQYMSSQKNNKKGQSVNIEQYAQSCKKDGVWANTIHTGGAFCPNQTLPEHLTMVADYGFKWVENFFTPLEDCLQRDVHEKLRDFNLEGPEAFRWQEYAVQKLRDIQQPSLVMNMAATGAGKTRMNVRALAALNTPEKGMRCAAVFNLKTLTLQTRDSVLHELNVPQKDVACIIGDKNAVALHNNPMLQDDYSEDDFKAGEDLEVDFVTVFEPQTQNVPHWVSDMGLIKQNLDGLILKPFLISTIDYVVNAGDPSRHIDHGLCLLRIANSDLILDEIDSYDPYAVAAVLRVVKMAAYFGRNVVVSSATLPQSIALSIWKAFHSGLRWRGDCHSKIVLLDNVNDQNQSCLIENIENEKEFIDFYWRALDEKIKRLESAAVLRRAKVVGNPEWKAGFCSNRISEDTQDKKTKAVEEYVREIKTSIQDLHTQNAFLVDKDGATKKVSFGLIRVANVGPAVSLAKEFIKDGLKDCAVYVCPYHAADIMLRRKIKESGLDEHLKRGQNWQETVKNKLATEIFGAEQENVIFLVVATPVEEVGRDHDFDWGIIEPSSIASIVQTAGRINRHRKCELRNDQVNIHILQYNIRALAGIYPAFCYPGNETKGGHLYTHDYNLDKLLNANKSEFGLDARMVFKKNNGNAGCDLAQHDEKSLQNILNRVQNLIQGTDGEKLCFAWLSQEFHSKYILRERSPQVHLRFARDGKNWCVQKLEWTRNGKQSSRNWTNIKENVGVSECAGKGIWWLSDEFDFVYKKAQEIDEKQKSNLVEEGFEFTYLQYQMPKKETDRLGFHWRAGGYKRQPK